MNPRQLDYARLRAVCKREGHKFFDAGDYNLNIIGVRTDDRRSDLFNDWLCLAFRQNDHEQLLVFAATTDPGTYWREHPMNVSGTAILKPGQYPGSHSLGQHQGKYPALVQSGPVTVYRDGNADALLDAHDGIPTETGHFGINIHKAGRLSDARSSVGKWSAGCQVVADTADFDLFLAICNRAAAKWGPRYTYTLLTEQQLWEGA